MSNIIINNISSFFGISKSNNTTIESEADRFARITKANAEHNLKVALGKPCCPYALGNMKMDILVSVEVTPGSYPIWLQVRAYFNVGSSKWTACNNIIESIKRGRVDNTTLMRTMEIIQK